MRETKAPPSMSLSVLDVLFCAFGGSLILSVLIVTMLRAQSVVEEGLFILVDIEIRNAGSSDYLMTDAAEIFIPYVDIVSIGNPSRLRISPGDARITTDKGRLVIFLAGSEKREQLDIGLTSQIDYAYSVSEDEQVIAYSASIFPVLSGTYYISFGCLHGWGSQGVTDFDVKIQLITGGGKRYVASHKVNTSDFAYPGQCTEKAIVESPFIKVEKPQ